MHSRCELIKGAALALVTFASTHGAWAQEAKVNLFKIITVKDDIIIGLTPDELQALGGNDASAVAHALAQKGDLTVWQYNVRRGQNGEMQQAPTARIGLLATPHSASSPIRRRTRSCRTRRRRSRPRQRQKPLACCFGDEG